MIVIVAVMAAMAVTVVVRVAMAMTMAMVPVVAMAVGMVVAMVVGVGVSMAVVVTVGVGVGVSMGMAVAVCVGRSVGGIGGTVGHVATCRPVTSVRCPVHCGRQVHLGSQRWLPHVRAVYKCAVWACQNLFETHNFCKFRNQS